MRWMAPGLSLSSYSSMMIQSYLQFTTVLNDIHNVKYIPSRVQFGLLAVFPFALHYLPITITSPYIIDFTHFLVHAFGYGLVKQLAT